jgi:hypothetical protein
MLMKNEPIIQQALGKNSLHMKQQVKVPITVLLWFLGKAEELPMSLVLSSVLKYYLC